MQGPLILLMICAPALAVLLRWLINRLRNGAQPRCTASARVVKKRAHHYEAMGRAGKWTPQTDYCITFRTEDGALLEFRLSARQYWRLEKGEKGLLTYQGTRFLQFQSD